MRGFQVYAVVFLASPLVASLYGCGDSSEEVATTSSSSNANSTEMESSAQPPLPPPPAPSVPVSAQSLGPSGETTGEFIAFSTVLVSWSKGDKDGAVEQLLSIRWDGPDVFANMPIMNLSEKGYGALPEDERTRSQKELHELVNTLRSLARHAFSTGENVQASGDKETAKAYYEAVLHLGQAMSSAEHVLVIRLSGKGIARGAQERLSGVK